MPGKRCPNCGAATFYGNQCTKCGLTLKAPVNGGKGGKGKKCPNCNAFTIFNNKCNNCGATFFM